MKRFIYKLAECANHGSRLRWWGETALIGAALTPRVGLVSQVLSEFEKVGAIGSGHALWVPAIWAAWVAPVWAAKGLVLHKVPLPETLFPEKQGASYRKIRFGAMELDETDLFTNILCVGSIGSGKTSTVILPGMDQLFRLYSRDIEDPASKDPKKKLGGFILESKGQFYEIAIYSMWEAGRNPAEDMVIIRPNPRIPAARFRDKATGHRFWLNALPCSTGSEAGTLLRGREFSSGLPIPEDVFSQLPKKFAHYRPNLQGMEFEVDGKDLFYIGWREKGGKLERVRYSPKRSDATPLIIDGKPIVVEKPKTLIFEDVDYFDNGIHYNLVDNKVGATEAANKLVLVAQMRDGGGGKGDNAFWVNNAKKHIGACIALMQVTHPEREVSGPDIQRLTATDSYCKTETDLLEQYLIAREADIEREPDPERRAWRTHHEVQVMRDVREYFTERWKTLDQKTKGIIKEEVTNMFNEFVADPYLQESFCSPATFNFEDAVQKGKVFAFVPGAEYETLAKSIGTLLKQDFQQMCLQRVAKAHMDKTRFILILNDECHKFIVSGGQQGGDEYFMSLSRESRVCNFMATQSDSWVVSTIGRDAANVYLQSFGSRIWLQNTDPDTNRRAAELCGSAKSLKRKSHEKGVGVRGFLGKEGMTVTTDTSYEKEEKFPPEKFVFLGQKEGIIFNKGEDARIDKSKKVKLAYAYATGPEGKGKVGLIMRSYLRDTLERSLQMTGKWEAVNHAPNHGVAPVPTPPPTDSTQPAAATPAATPAGSSTSAATTSAIGSGPSTTMDPSAPSPTTAPAGPVTKPPVLSHAPSRTNTGVVYYQNKNSNTGTVSPEVPVASKPAPQKPVGNTPLTGAKVRLQEAEYIKFRQTSLQVLKDVVIPPEISNREHAKTNLANASRENKTPEQTGNKVLTGKEGKHGGGDKPSQIAQPQTPITPADAEHLPHSDNGEKLQEVKNDCSDSPGPDSVNLNETLNFLPSPPPPKLP